MNRLFPAVGVLAASLLSACSSGAVKLDRNTVPAPVSGSSRTIESEACGFQLLLLIPLGINSQHRRAVEELYARADGDYVSDIRLVDHWGYGFVGTNYCVQLTATAIHADPGGPLLTRDPAAAVAAPGPVPAVAPSAMATIEAAPPTDASHMRATTDLHAGPRSSDAVLGSITAGTAVSIQRTLENGTGIWCLITVGNSQGWVPIDTVSP